VSDGVLQEQSPLADVLRPGRYGRPTGEPSVTIAECPGLAIVTLAARRGAEVTLHQAVRQAFGLDLPAGPKRVQTGDVAFVGIGPGQWLATSEQPALGGGLAARLVHIAGKAASVVDQSHGRVVLRIAGPKVREALAKGCSIDLHPRAFLPGDAASTRISHINMLLAQVDEAPTYELIVPANFAESFWFWLTISAAEFGYRVEG
jgi:sarcosine oxidase subunit gamma